MAGLALLAGAVGSTGTLATVATVAGAGLRAIGALRQGREMSAQQTYQAQQADQAEDAARAQGQRAAANQYRQGRIIASQQQAIAAGVGGGSDASVLDIMGDTDAEVDLAARTEMFNAEQQARGYADQATTSRANARSARMSGTLGFIGAGVQGVSAMYDRFGRQNQQPATVNSRYG